MNSTPKCPCCKNEDHKLIDRLDSFNPVSSSAFIVPKYGSVTVYVCTACGCVFVNVKDGKIVR
jgi:hypothetical protein